MKRRGWETFEPPPKAVDVALRRTAELPLAATYLWGTGQDFLKTLTVSAYLQGITDTIYVFEHARREGTYEEER